MSGKAVGMEKMNAETARENVQQMRAETPRPARRRVWQLAIAGDRLTEEAKGVYRQALKEDFAK